MRCGALLPALGCKNGLSWGKDIFRYSLIVDRFRARINEIENSNVFNKSCNLI